MRRMTLLATLGLALLPALLLSAQADEGERGRVERVLLISIDGLHALDVANYVAHHPGSALAELSGRGVTFTNARTPANSDSFPGLLALVTGGSPRTHGLFYDYSYDRTIWPPDHGGCTGPAGTQTIRAARPAAAVRTTPTPPSTSSRAGTWTAWGRQPRCSTTD